MTERNEQKFTNFWDNIKKLNEVVIRVLAESEPRKLKKKTT